MNNKEYVNKCTYDSGRFRLRKESDYAIVDELGEYPPIMVLMDGDKDCEGQYMDRASLLHLLNEQDEEIKSLKLEYKLLLEEMKQFRDKLTIYLEIKGDMK